MGMPFKNFRYGKILGLPIMAGNVSSVADAILQTPVSIKGYICIANVHMLVTATKCNKLKVAMNSSLFNTSDGMPLVWALRLNKINEAERVSGPDLMIRLCERAQDYGYSVYFYGSTQTVADEMKVRLPAQFPNLKIAGVESPSMLPDEPVVDQEVVARINASGARIVFVGLGCPKQELWMHAHSPYIQAVLIGVGAGFDFFAGTVQRAPVWMQRSGLEWFYRLCREPRRLWKRYLVTNSLFILYWLLEYMGMRK